MPIDLPDHMREAMLALGIGAESAPVQVQNPCPSVPQCGTTNPGYVEPPWFGLLRFATGPIKRGACLFGPRGTGKTRAVHELARTTGTRLVTFQAAAGCTIDDLVGVRDLRDGKTVFTPGALADAVSADCWLLIEEANAMHPAVFSKMNTLLDGSGDKLRLPDGSALEVGPNFRAVLAFNEGYTGTREVNPALRDRLLPIYTGYLPETEESRIVAERTGCDQGTALQVVGFANKVRAANLGFDLSPRALFTLLELQRCLSLSWTDAFACAILDLIGDPMAHRATREAVRQVAELDGLFGWTEPAWTVPQCGTTGGAR